MYTHAALGVAGVGASVGLFLQTFNAHKYGRKLLWRAGLAVTLFTALTFGRLVWCDAVQL
jgi:hypothetical protein